MFFSSYMLVAMTIDRYQSICYPISHRVWKPQESHRKIAIFWVIAFLLCAPQILVFGIGHDGICESQLGPLKGNLS